MHPLLPLVVAEFHRQDLLHEAELARLERRARLVPRATPRWRRAAGRVVDVASHALEGAATRLDPTIHPSERRLDPAH
jgi:hypothetical protein